MKKRKVIVFWICLLAFAMTFCLSACKANVKHTGIDKYRPSSYFTSNLLPYEERNRQYEIKYDEFLTKYEYMEGDYLYMLQEDAPFHNFRETAIMWLQYEPEVYEEAKSYMLETIPLSEKYRYEYNGYCFIVNLKSAKHSAEEGDFSEFPNCFLAVCHNDSKNTLVFIGLYVSGDQMELRDEILATSDWGAFLKEYYYPFYDFDA